MKSKLLLLSLVSLLLSGCSLFGDDDVEYIAPAPEVEDNLIEPNIVWEQSVGDGIGDYFSRLKPAVDDGRVVAASRDGVVAAYDAKTGERQWRIDLSDRKRELFGGNREVIVSGGVTLRYGQVFLGTENGEVISLSAEDGSEIWRILVKAEVLAAPTVDQGIVVVNTGNGRLFGLDARSGEEKWTFKQELPSLTLRGVSSVAAAQGGVLLGKASGKVAVLDIQRGIEYWEQDAAPARTGSELERVVDVDAAPVVVGPNFYVAAYNGYLQAMELRSGRSLWKQEYSSYRGLSVKGNRIYLTDSQGFVYAIDRNSGAELWSYNALENRGVTESVPFGDYVVTGDFEGYLYWLDEANGQLLAVTDIGGDGLYTTPVVSDDTMYIQTRDGTLTALQLP